MYVILTRPIHRLDWLSYSLPTTFKMLSTPSAKVVIHFPQLPRPFPSSLQANHKISIFQTLRRWLLISALGKRKRVIGCFSLYKCQTTYHFFLSHFQSQFFLPSCPCHYPITFLYHCFLADISKH